MCLHTLLNLSVDTAIAQPLIGAHTLPALIEVVATDVTGTVSRTTPEQYVMIGGKERFVYLMCTLQLGANHVASLPLSYVGFLPSMLASSPSICVIMSRLFV